MTITCYLSTRCCMFLRTDSRTSLEDCRTQTHGRTCWWMLRGLAEKDWTHLNYVQQTGGEEQQQASHTIKHKLSSELAVQLFKLTYKEPVGLEVENKEENFKSHDWQQCRESVFKAVKSFTEKIRNTFIYIYLHILFRNTSHEKGYILFVSTTYTSIHL